MFSVNKKGEHIFLCVLRELCEKKQPIGSNAHPAEAVIIGDVQNFHCNRNTQEPETSSEDFSDNFCNASA